MQYFSLVDISSHCLVHFARKGDKIGGGVRLNELECHTFKEPPDAAAAGVKYFLPTDT